ncbi:phage tail tape measure protein [Bernardetia sp. Wsw4-3y2]|uniref:phage tail tape measure protein n=1 Tax=Bernardetia sp. Wsw4-3y2 TaxID=3127471 RepID=UPI0030D3AA93
MASFYDITIALKDLASKPFGKAENAAKSYRDENGKLRNELGQFVAQSKKTAFSISSLGNSFDKLKDNAIGFGKGLLVGGALAGVAAVGLGLSDLVQESNAFLDIQKQVSQTFGLTGEAAENTSIKLSATSKTFKQDANELTTAANAFSQAYSGLSGEVTTSLIQTGFLAGADAGGEFLDKLKEYPTQLAAVGLSAKESIAFLSLEPKMGIYSDKGVDALKEANLRLQEMPKATSDALQKLSKGGLNVQKTMLGLRDGSLSTFDAVQDISKALQGVDKQTRQEAIANIFGGAGEDAGNKFIDTLATMNLEFDKLIDKSNPFIARQLRQLALQEDLAKETSKFSKVFGFLSDSATNIFGSLKLEWYKLVNSVLGDFNPNEMTFLDKIQNAIPIIGAFAREKLVPPIKSFFTLVKTGFDYVNNNWVVIADAFKGVAIGVGLVTAGFVLMNLANPMFLIGLGVTALVGLFGYAYAKSEVFRGSLFAIWEVGKTVFMGFYEVGKTAIGGVMDMVSGLVGAFEALSNGDFSGAFDSLKKVGSGFMDTATSALKLANPSLIIAEQMPNIVQSAQKGYAEGSADFQESQSKKGTSLLDTLGNLTKGVANADGNSDAFDWGMYDAGQKPTNTNQNLSNSLSGLGAGGSGGTDTVSNVQSQAPKNFTITINTLVGEITVSTTNLREGMGEIKRQVTEALASAVNDSQLVIE